MFIIHATEDVWELLSIASAMDLIIQYDGPADVPAPILLRDEEIKSFRSGAFMLYKKNWIFGEREYNKIEDGHYEGKFFQKPSTNFVSILIHCSGERNERGQIYLGSGSVSRDIKWYSPEDHAVYEATGEVKEVFDHFIEAMKAKRKLKGGVHKYAVLPYALEKLEEGSARPPFDYIEWP